MTENIDNKLNQKYITVKEGTMVLLKDGGDFNYKKYRCFLLWVKNSEQLVQCVSKGFL